METNYELKHKCLLVPLKVVLLVLAMVLVGFPTFAQSGKSMKVANNQQLTEAMYNSSVSSVILAAGYYDFINYQAEDGTVLTKGKTDGGNRDLQCLYFTIGSNVCFDPENPGDFVQNIAQAGTSDAVCPGCCPGPDEGTWSVQGTPVGATVNMLDPLNFQTMTFEVDMPGAYLMRYTWGPPYNSLVETQYYFYGPVVVDLSAPDVCGTSTLVDFTLSSVYPDPITVVGWTLNGAPYAGPDATEQFLLEVPVCGLYELCVTVEPSRCPPVTECIIIDFSCDPLADAGPDINVCNDVCYYSLVGSTGLYTFSPNNDWSWVQIGGPNELDFEFPFEEVTAVCVDELAACPYGEYEVEFQVQNGQCYDSDSAILRFYEQPVADAGLDQHICNTFSFSLAAVPYVYCGVEGVNYWSESHWELVSQADPAAVVTIVDPTDPNTTININTASATCAYGPYVFIWKETNQKPGEVGGCYDEDLVTITIYEDPEPYAGDDMVFCNTFAFSLYGIGDEPCYENTVVVYSWDKSEQPGDCQVTFTPGDEPATWLEFGTCDEDSCKYGKYIFTLTQSNGYMDGNTFVEVCSTSDDVEVWIFEEVIANAGPDQEICDEFAFSMGAIPTTFCGEADVNYFTWGVWELVSGPTTSVTFSDINDPAAGVVIDGQSVPCPYGSYTFKWTEYNGFGTPFQGCWGEDFVTIVISETPESISAGNDLSFCDWFDFTLDGAVDLPCTEETAYSIVWTLVSQPGTCDVYITPNTIDPAVSITNCAPCQYGAYVFEVTQMNGYYNDEREFVEICSESDQVTVWIFEQPVDVYAGDDMLLCNDFAFSLVATGAEYCGDFGVNYNNWYTWVLVSGPVGADCEVTFSNPTGLETNVVIDNCLGECAFGEWSFRFTEYNGNDVAYCYDYDDVSVFIFEQPVADAGADVAECVDAGYTLCYNMTANLEHCYSMYGVWTKSCGPGDVVFDDVNSPTAEACFSEPGRYEFTWYVWNDAEDCEASDTVIFDLLEQPIASLEVGTLEAPCDSLCIDLGLAEINKYVYFGTEAGECPNYWDNAFWSLIEGPDGIDPLQVVFADDTDPATDMCVSWYGAYTVRWTEVNRSVDEDFECSDYVDVFVEFYETPEPFAGDDDAICGNCYTLQGVQYEYLPAPNQHLNDYYYWESLPTNPCAVTFSDFESLTPQVCIPDAFECYGTYGFVLHESNGDCFGSDTVYICFSYVPGDVAVCFNNNPNDCGPWNNQNGPEFTYYGCLLPDEVLEVCAEGCTYIELNPWCDCLPGFDWSNPAFFGYTFEWSLISPAGTIYDSQPGYYDFENGWWHYPWIDICWGECCDTARLYLTITAPAGECGLACENTMEYKFFVHHKPCANIEGPDVSEVDAVVTYCNVCPEEFDTDCLLYTWTAEHCGEIISGQGTECIEVLWTDYNINGGWGEITLTVFDTCTGCCNYDEMLVKIWPAGTLGDATLSGHVLYHNNGETPLNGVEIQLWNGGIPVMSTTSFNDIEGGNGLGYFEFTGINAVTSFGLTASYDAPWYGANATDALAVELKVINNLPGGFVYDNVVAEAMDVNNNTTITATDALWIKQRAINMIGYFPAGNWVFDPALSTTAVTGYELFTLNAGDANRSNNPNSGKSMPAIDLVNDGTMNVVTGQVFELPIRIAKANQFGAITLDLGYNPALVEVVEVETMEGMLSNIANGTVSIAWSNLNPMVLADNDVVVTLKVKAIGEIASTETLFSIGMNSEFADQSANVIEPVTLKSFGVTTDPAALDYFLSTNRPNPFNTSTFIEYTMPETGKVRLSVLDMLGQELAVIVDETQTAGSYTVEFSAAGLATGVYIYKITVDGETRDFISTERMVISH